MTVSGAYIADLFSGTGGIARAARRSGWPSRVWDTKNGAAGDLLRRKVLKDFEQDVAAGRVLGAVLGPPCSSFSRAFQRVTKWRDERGIVLPGLHAEAAAKCRQGDACGTMHPRMRTCRA